MKNYEIKNAMAELSAKQRIVVNSKRIAFLVPNMFSRLCKGFAKKSLAAGQMAIGATVLAGAAVGHGIASAATAVGHGFQSAGNAIGDAVKTAANDAVVARDDYNANKIANINETVEKKEESIASVKANPNISDKDKNYIIKAYESDIERLRNKTIKVANAPRRLLISLVFIQKLVTNRRKKKATAAEAQAFLNSVPEQVATPVAETPVTEQVVTPQVDTPAATVNVGPAPTVGTTPAAPEAPANKMTVDEAIAKYIELNNKKLDILDDIRMTEERLNAGKTELSKCQDEMTKLVSEYGLTQEMVQAKYTR